jgi:hypothetical protein
MANPSARVSARRRGELPWQSQMAAFRLIEAMLIDSRNLLIMLLTLSA